MIECGYVGEHHCRNAARRRGRRTIQLKKTRVKSVHHMIHKAGGVRKQDNMPEPTRKTTHALFFEKEERKGLPTTCVFTAWATLRLRHNPIYVMSSGQGNI